MNKNLVTLQATIRALKKQICIEIIVIIFYISNIVIFVGAVYRETGRLIELHNGGIDYFLINEFTKDTVEKRAEYLAGYTVIFLTDLFVMLYFVRMA